MKENSLMENMVEKVKNIIINNKFMKVNLKMEKEMEKVKNIHMKEYLSMKDIFWMVWNMDMGRNII